MSVDGMLNAVWGGAASPAVVAPSRLMAVDPRPWMTPWQVAVRDDPSRHRILLAGRQSGKTTEEEYELLETAAAHENVAVIYLNTTIKRAVATVWDELKRFNNEMGLGALAHESKHEMRFRSGSTLFVSGAETQKMIDRWRGVKRKKLVVIDEAQDWDPHLLKYTITVVLLTAMGDVEGRIVVSGTGGKPKGYWREITEAPPEAFTVRKGLIFDNPKIADPQREIDIVCDARSCDESDPSIRREYFVEFTVDGVHQILQVTVANLVPRAELPKGRVRKIIAADFGTVDQCAVVVWCWDPTVNHLYVSETARDVGLGASEQVKLVRQVVERNKEGLAGIVGDGGGLGKALVVDLKNAYQFFNVEPAAKQNKVPAMRMLAGDLRNGFIQIADDERQLIEDMRDPEWDPDHIGDRIKGHVPDLVDAALYGYRKAKELFRYQAPAVVPQPKTRVEQYLEAYQRQVKEREEYFG